MNRCVIDVRQLNKHFGDKHVVKDLSMQVHAGEIFGFLGPNGSGKTTSIRMMCGLLTPDSGSGTCLGFDVIRDSAQVKRRIGYMTQRFSLWEDLTIRENLDFIARIYGMPKRRAVVERTLEQLNLGSRSHQLAGALSGGWKQRVALAACMLHQPELLLLDEPTAGVDPQARRDFWEEIHLLAAQGVSVLVSTHYMDEAERCHKLAYLSYGKLLVQGTVDEVIASQDLSTWVLHGGAMAGVAQALRGSPGVHQIIIFGNSLHVIGEQGDTLAHTLAELHGRMAFRYEQIATGLEDTFIYLMKRAEDNFA
ncbi:multidrug ABC transporter ATP-binding protein [Massilia violaceinigra]|uniref:Multidrug ABC transporter ATP-binding protein n=1 Tax=Massilia violaceinigra TaxID=2045208 RepID=A0A2D2DFH7_9BURK|nr:MULTISPECIES: ABC transporter ATP-binding protein [Massilia]ATQ73741.1 multidrug ABC transporter ATP-binding protein [Massilia violaceinigra]MDQ1921327.1 ABC transporter ATP-binding protein [Massilia sp. CCM 9206]